jgi:Fur family iron response transcriptional regulator
MDDGPEHGLRRIMHADRNGCPWHDVKSMLREVGLRPTRQRMALGWLLFGKGARHLTAEMLYEEATIAKVPVSLATVYNTLHQFTGAGIMSEVVVGSGQSYFDTNPTSHYHSFDPTNGQIIDIPPDQVRFLRLPSPPPGKVIERIDVVVRIRNADRAQQPAVAGRAADDSSSERRLATSDESARSAPPSRP